MAQGSGCARDSKAGTHGIGRCSGCPSSALDQMSLRWDKPLEEQGQGSKGAKAKEGGAKLDRGRDLHDAGAARPRDRARQFPRHQSGWLMFPH